MELQGDCLTLENIQAIIEEIGKEANKPRVHIPHGFSTPLGPNIFKEIDVSEYLFNQSLKKMINESLKIIYIKKELRELKKLYEEVS